MKTIFKTVALSATLIAAPAFIAGQALAQAARPAARPAAAPAAPTAVGPVSIGVADLDVAVANTTAFQAALQQIQTTYAAPIAAWQARGQAIQTELGGLRSEIQTLQSNSATPRATLDQKVAAYRTRADAAQTELDRLGAPFLIPRAYAQEQVALKLDDALRAAMAAQRINVLIKPETIMVILPGAPNLTPAITAQLNVLVRTASITPPAGWQPGQPPAGAPQSATPQGR